MSARMCGLISSSLLNRWNTIFLTVIYFEIDNFMTIEIHYVLNINELLDLTI